MDTQTSGSPILDAEAQITDVAGLAADLGFRVVLLRHEKYRWLCEITSLDSGNVVYGNIDLDSVYNVLQGMQAYKNTLKE